MFFLKILLSYSATPPAARKKIIKKQTAEIFNDTTFQKLVYSSTLKKFLCVYQYDYLLILLKLLQMLI